MVSIVKHQFYTSEGRTKNRHKNKECINQTNGNDIIEETCECLYTMTLADHSKYECLNKETVN
jgi:hypothetical protein